MNLAHVIEPSFNVVAWIDKDGNRYRMAQIRDSHLKNIVHLVNRGGGNKSFVTKEVAENLYDEAIRRGITIDVDKDRLLKNVQMRRITAQMDHYNY